MSGSSSSTNQVINVKRASRGSESLDTLAEPLIPASTANRSSEPQSTPTQSGAMSSSSSVPPQQPLDLGSSPKDAQEVADEDPLSPHQPAGTGLERETGIDTTKEGKAQMIHENPSTLADTLKGLVGLGETPTPAQFTQPAPDGNTGNLSYATLTAIAAKFQPALWLSSNEIYRPCSLEWYLERCNLVYDPVGNSNVKEYVVLKRGVVGSDLTEASQWALLTLYRQNNPNDDRFVNMDFNNWERRRVHLELMDEAGQQGESFDMLNQIPFLCRIRRYQDHWELLYIATFAYNGPFTCCCTSMDAHCCDIEHITVRTNVDLSAVEWVYYGSHGVADGIWRTPDEVEMIEGPTGEKTRPVVYASDHSHGLYPESGAWCRICGFANDVVLEHEDEHSLWNPQVPPKVLLDRHDPRFESVRATQGYMDFDGTMGEDGVSPPHNQGWWDGETSYQNNCFRRCWWPCRYISWTGDKNFCYNSCQSKIDFGTHTVPPRATPNGVVTPNGLVTPQGPPAAQVMTN